MNAITFKLTHPSSSSQTRRVTFQGRPTWLALADRVHSLFKISPLENVAVSYIDVEGDEVTLSTQEELEDYYQDMDGMGLWKPGNAVKFTVVDLGTARQQQQNVQNADSDEEWQHFTQEHTTVDADDTNIVIDEPMNHGPSSASTLTSGTRTPTPRPEEKGKGKEIDAGEPSHTDGAPAPNLAFYDQPVLGILQAQQQQQEQEHARDSDAMDVEPKESQKETPSSDDNDPPLPPLDSTSLQNDHERANPNFSSDISNLITSLTSIIASHPELSEGVRNVILNAARGNYWPSQREALYNAAGEIRTSLRSANQEAGEAGRKLAEALEGFFRTFAQFAMNGNPVQEASTESNANLQASDSGPNSNTRNPFLSEDDFPRLPGQWQWNVDWAHGRWGPHRFGGWRGRHPHRPHHAHRPPPRHAPSPQRQHSPPPPPPPPPRPFDPFGTSGHPQSDDVNVPGGFPNLPSVPPFPPFGPFTSARISRNGDDWLRNLSRGAPGANENVTNSVEQPEITIRRRSSNLEATTTTTTDDGIRVEPVPQDNNATAVETNNDNSGNSSLHCSSTLPVHSSRHAHFGRRAATHEGRSSTRRVLRGLEDMGFTSRTHPNIDVRVRDLLASTSAPNTTEKEGRVINIIANEFLSVPAASGSGVEVPGGWN